MPTTITLAVTRYRPEQESEPTVQNYEIPYDKDWVILVGIFYFPYTRLPGGQRVIVTGKYSIRGGSPSFCPR